MRSGDKAFQQAPRQSPETGCSHSTSSTPQEISIFLESLSLVRPNILVITTITFKALFPEK
jgi:hypothetical protein